MQFLKTEIKSKMNVLSLLEGDEECLRLMLEKEFLIETSPLKYQITKKGFNFAWERNE